MKKILSLVVGAFMVLSLSVCAFATDNGTASPKVVQDTVKFNWLSSSVKQDETELTRMIDATALDAYEKGKSALEKGDGKTAIWQFELYEHCAKLKSGNDGMVFPDDYLILKKKARLLRAKYWLEQTTLDAEAGNPFNEIGDHVNTMKKNIKEASEIVLRSETTGLSDQRALPLYSHSAETKEGYTKDKDK